MAGEAPRNGVAEGQADLLPGGEPERGLASSPRRHQDEPRPSSSRCRSFASSNDVASSPSSVSSSGSDVESDDSDDTFPRPQCEYEEIPSFRYIATPLRWWKTRKRVHHSKKSCAGAAGKGEEAGSTGRTEVECSRETRIELVHFDGHPVFTMEDLMAASTVVLGEGNYGTLLRATLDDGNQVAMRKLTWADSTTREFEADVNMLGKVRQPNLLALRACYFPPVGEESFLVFDYMPKGSLSAFLHGRLKFILCDSSNPPDWPRLPHTFLGPHNRIDWPTRMNIAIGIARGLHYLHTQKNVVHGNLTSRNILLDDHTNAKISDYGLSHHMSLAPTFHLIAGTLGYPAPELSLLKKPNTKTDVYSLGVIMLELLTGKSPEMARNNLRFPEWVARMVENQWTDKVFDPDLRMDATGTAGDGLLDTLNLALRCVDPSPDARPEVWQVLQQLEGIKPKLAGATKGTATTKGGDKPTDTCAHAVGTPTTAAPSEGRMAHPLEDPVLGPSETCNVLANDGNLQARVPPPINPCKDKPEELATLASKGDLQDGDQIPSPSPAEEIIQDNSGYEDSVVNLSPARPEGNNGASFPIFNVHEKTTVEEKTEEGMRAGGTDATSGDTVPGQLPSIDWAEIPLEAHLEVPTSPPLISCAPDSGYQRYFQTLHDLAYRSPLLPSNVLEVQLNRMIMGLHSLGYPLDTWLKAAVLVLGLARKREYIEHHVDEYFKVHVETQLAGLTSATDPIKEEISRTQSDTTTLEQKEDLAETIARLEDQLAVLKTEREGVVDSLTTFRDRLAAAEAKMQSVLVDIERLNQRYSAILGQRSELLGQLPSLDEAFDSSFREILTRKF